MKNATHLVSVAVLISASLALGACQGQTTLGEGLGDADQSVCAHGQFTTFVNDPQGNQFGPEWLALNGGEVFWYNPGGDGADGNGPAQVKSVPESGGTPTTLAESTNVPVWAGPEEILSQPVLDDTNLYWIRDNFDLTTKAQVSWSVVSVPQAGGAEKTLFTSTEDVGGLLAADGESFYFSSKDQNFPTLTKVYSVPKTGGLSKTLATFTGSTSDPTSSGVSNILVDDTNLYFSYDGKVLSMPKGGGTPMVLATTGTSYIAMMDAERLYWQAMNNGDIVSVKKSGGAVTTLATGFMPGTLDLTVDDACVYGLSWDDHAVYAVPKAGGQLIAAAALPSQVTAPSGFAADTTGVYFSDANGFLMKLPR